MFRKISNIIIALFLVCALGILAMVGIPLILGNQLYAVLTASMEPTYPSTWQQQHLLLAVGGGAPLADWARGNPPP